VAARNGPRTLASLHQQARHWTLVSSGNVFASHAARSQRVRTTAPGNLRDKGRHPAAVGVASEPQPGQVHVIARHQVVQRHSDLAQTDSQQCPTPGRGGWPARTRRRWNGRPDSSSAPRSRWRHVRWSGSPARPAFTHTPGRDHRPGQRLRAFPNRSFQRGWWWQNTAGSGPCTPLGMQTYAEARWSPATA